MDDKVYEILERLLGETPTEPFKVAHTPSGVCAITVPATVNLAPIQGLMGILNVSISDQRTVIKFAG